jgi:rare lipoprotein A
MRKRSLAGARVVLLYVTAFFTAATGAASVRSLVVPEGPAISQNPRLSEDTAVSERPQSSEKFAWLNGSGQLLPAFDDAAIFFNARSDMPLWNKSRGVLAINKYAVGPRETSYGLASYYGSGSRTATGETVNEHELTAAHRTLPFGTRVRVTSLSTGQSVTVRINDRGPFIPGRIVDLSHSAAEKLGLVGRGVEKVKLDVIERPSQPTLAAYSSIE